MFGDTHQWTITLKCLKYTNKAHTRVINIDLDNIAQNDEYNQWMIWISSILAYDKHRVLEWTKVC